MSFPTVIHWGVLRQIYATLKELLDVVSSIAIMDTQILGVLQILIGHVQKSIHDQPLDIMSLLAETCVVPK